MYQHNLFATVIIDTMIIDKVERKTQFTFAAMYIMQLVYNET